MVFQDIFKIIRLHRLLYSISHKTGLFYLFSNRCYKKINTGGSFADLYKDDSHMLQVKSQVKLRILTIFNFFVEIGKSKKTTVLQNSKNLIFFYETSEKIRSSDQNLSLFQLPTFIIRYTVSHNFPHHLKIGVEFLVFRKHQKRSFLSLLNTEICLLLPELVLST